MTSSDDARAVQVFVEDQSQVSADDVYDWLKIIGDIDEMKMRYDAARQCPFYFVRFKRSTAAQQAVCFLDGKRLKNHVVTIRSIIFTKRQSVNEENTEVERELSSAAGPTVSSTAVANLHLPSNHRMPKDLQMSEALIDCIPDLSTLSDLTKENARALADLQKSYCHVSEKLATTKRVIETTDKEVMLMLHGGTAHGAASATLEDPACVVEAPSEQQLHRGKRIRNVMPIPCSFFDPASLISKLTRHIGPVSAYSFSTVTNDQTFNAVVEFANADDVSLALKLLTERNDSLMRENKRARVEEQQTNGENLALLSTLGWCEDTCLSPLGSEALPVRFSTPHCKVEEIIRLVRKERK